MMKNISILLFAAILSLFNLEPCMAQGKSKEDVPTDATTQSGIRFSKALSSKPSTRLRSSISLCLLISMPNGAGLANAWQRPFSLKTPSESTSTRSSSAYRLMPKSQRMLPLPNNTRLRHFLPWHSSPMTERQSPYL